MKRTCSGLLTKKTRSTLPPVDLSSERSQKAKGKPRENESSQSASLHRATLLLSLSPLSLTTLRCPRLLYRQPPGVNGKDGCPAPLCHQLNLSLPRWINLRTSTRLLSSNNPRPSRLSSLPKPTTQRLSGLTPTLFRGGCGI